MGDNQGLHALRTCVLIGAVTALTSQVYLSVFINDFRISPSVILLPFLLMTIGRQLSTVGICSITALIVFTFRILIVGWNAAPCTMSFTGSSSGSRSPAKGRHPFRRQSSPPSTAISEPISWRSYSGT